MCQTFEVNEYNSDGKMTQQWLNSVGEQALDLVVNLHIYDAFGEMELGELLIISGLGKIQRSGILRKQSSSRVFRRRRFLEEMFPEGLRQASGVPVDLPDRLDSLDLSLHLVEVVPRVVHPLRPMIASWRVIKKSEVTHKQGLKLFESLS